MENCKSCGQAVPFREVSEEVERHAHKVASRAYDFAFELAITPDIPGDDTCWKSETRGGLPCLKPVGHPDKCGL